MVIDNFGVSVCYIKNRKIISSETIQTISLSDVYGMVSFVKDHSISYMFITDTSALLEGYVDIFKENNIVFIDQDKVASRTEDYAIFAKAISGKYNIALVNLTVFKNHESADIYMISYPKTGRTWLRALIGKYLSLKYKVAVSAEDKILSTEFMTVRSNLPRTSFSHDGSAMRSKTKYQNLSHDKTKYTDKKVVFLGRNIKDTLVSAYFQTTKRIKVFEGTISEFIRTEEFGVLKILTFYNIWLQNRRIPKSFLFIRYEDLHRNTSSTVRKVLDFIGEVNVDEKLLESSVKYCSFSNLRKLERQDTFKSNILRPANNVDSESFKVRRGRVEGYREYMSEKDVEFIDQVISDYGFDFKKFCE